MTTFITLSTPKQNRDNTLALVKLTVLLLTARKLVDPSSCFFIYHIDKEATDLQIISGLIQMKYDPKTDITLVLDIKSNLFKRLKRLKVSNLSKYPLNLNDLFKKREYDKLVKTLTKGLPYATSTTTNL